MSKPEFKDGIKDQPPALQDHDVSKWYNGSGGWATHPMENSALKNKVIKTVTFYTMITTNKKNMRKIDKHLNSYMKEYFNKHNNGPIGIATPIFTMISGKKRIGFQINYWANTDTDIEKIARQIRGFTWFIASLFYGKHQAKSGTFRQN